MKNRIICSKDDDYKELNIKPPIFICAPMVRYSKLPFRQLSAMYGCNLAYTPMIYASAFVVSEKCRQVEFVTNDNDFPIVQFAANKPVDFANAAELVYGQCKGIDLNCGCPKRDVRKCGCGSKLLEDPELIADIIKQTRARISDCNFTISIKIRINSLISSTIELCRQAEMVGVSHIAVHGRTINMRDSDPCNLEAIALIKSASKVPIFANGGCKSYDDAIEIVRTTKVDGVMVANGLLANPALFAGYKQTPDSCILDWIDLDKKFDIPFELFHHHLNFMMRSKISKAERIIFNNFRTKDEVLNFINTIL